MASGFEDEFWDLAADLVDTQVVFYSSGEPGWTVNRPQAKRLIAINKSLSWKHKFFVLTHEVGHLFDTRSRVYLVPDFQEDEKIAHKRAKALLENIDPELVEEYVDFFNKKTAKRSK